MHKTESVNYKGIDRLISPAVYIAYLLMLPSIGILVACIGFCDPDTCWHLALGQWICAHGGLPYIDPFSTNVANVLFVAKNLPLIQHEWLTDVIFYRVFAAFALKGLLVLTAVLSLCSFVIIPSILMLRNGVPRIIALAATTLAICASSFRLWVRPDEFSFLFMSLLILINDIALTTTSWKKMAACSVFVFAIMALWGNCHGMFVIGLAYLAGYFLIAILQSLWPKTTAEQLKRGLLFSVPLLSALFVRPGIFSFGYICVSLSARQLCKATEKTDI